MTKMLYNTYNNRFPDRKFTRTSGRVRTYRYFSYLAASGDFLFLEFWIPCSICICVSKTLSLLLSLYLSLIFTFFPLLSLSLSFTPYFTLSLFLSHYLLMVASISTLGNFTGIGTPPKSRSREIERKCRGNGKERSRSGFC